MDWARDNKGLSDEDLETVFRYDPKETTVITILASNNWRGEIFSLKNDKEWDNWITQELPSIHGKDAGLVLVLAKRSGEPTLQGVKKTSFDDWLRKADERPPVAHLIKRSDTFAALSEKAQLAGYTPQPMSSGRRGVRTVPFSRKSFGQVTSQLCSHGTIARVVSRSDVPVFTYDKVNMGQPACVYNCRSSNAWEMDLALTATHFPKIGLTFSILFGCPFSIEKEIITRLSHVGNGAAHPLLVPGIFAELERERHVKLVDEMVNRVETKIFELDTVSNDLEGPKGEVAQRRAREKRTAYLDLAYLRNALVSWNTQLAKMTRNSQHLVRNEYNPTAFGNGMMERSFVQPIYPKITLEPQYLQEQGGFMPTFVPEYQQAMHMEKHSGVTFDQMQNVGNKITARLVSIQDEYDDKIRDCTMRVDGMAMATQWSHGETNVEIALATNRDSRHMRSIALVTMVFLPGTFFASMFSMTFFNWSSDPGSTTVSAYLWVYFLVTLIFTGLTIGSWYYIVIFRPSRQSKVEDEEIGDSKKPSRTWRIPLFEEVIRRCQGRWLLFMLRVRHMTGKAT